MNYKQFIIVSLVLIVFNLVIKINEIPSSNNLNPLCNDAHFLHIKAVTNFKCDDWTKSGKYMKS